MKIEVNGVKITLTNSQLKEIDEQVKKNKPIEERILTVDDLYRELNTTKEKLLPYKETSTKEQKAINAFTILLELAKLFNQGEVLDFTKNTYKYIPYKYFSGGFAAVFVCGSYCALYCPGGLFYKNRELAEISLKNFKDIWEDYWMY